MRIIVFGVGAVGGAVAAALCDAGREVIGIARGSMLEALKSGPLTVRTPDGHFSASLPVVASPAEIAFRPGDAVLLTMKSQDTPTALEALRAAGLRDQPIFCFQNGIANEDMALRLFPNVHGVTVMMPVTYLTPGEVVANGSPKIGLFDIGRYPSGADDDDRALAEAIDGPRIGGFVHEDVMASKRGKLVLNVSNAIDAAIGAEFRQGDFAKRAREEAEAAFHGAGLGWQNVGLDDPRRKALMQMKDVPGIARAGSSTTQSLLRGTGSVETDYLNGEIARLGRLHGVPVPVNSFLTELGAEMAGGSPAPGSLDEAALLARFAAWQAR
ncbi:ketopantoate reductase family protein [Rhodobacterales bacterium HKCCE3408]|nr:ketopantoate reductase family protein [Rhodobacterales bacterium HKCCE3408]